MHESNTYEQLFDDSIRWKFDESDTARGKRVKGEMKVRFMAITSISCCIGSANSSEGPMSVSASPPKRIFGVYGQGHPGTRLPGICFG